MAPNAATALLTVNEYDALCGHEAGWEYWFGEARRKPVPTYLHGLLKIVLGGLLSRAGYIASVESDVKIASDWQPRPDVCGVLEVQEKYVTRPENVVIFEVLSEDDPIVAKCRHYSEIKIEQIFVFDADQKTIATWDGEKLQPVIDVKLANGVTITGATIWSEFMKLQAQQHPPASMTL
jgi:Uma2 family endonuclease